MKKNILFLNGVPDDNKVEIVRIRENGTIAWMTAGAHVSNSIQSNFLQFSTINFDTNKIQNIHYFQNRIDAIFNQISDADSHTITLKKAEDFCTSKFPNTQLFNAPHSIKKTSRDNIYKLLHDIEKLHVPKTVKLTPKSPEDIYEAINNELFAFPVIFRHSGEHGGKSTMLIKDNKEKFHSYILDGKHSYYLTQYVDYKENGIYAKYRLIVVDGEVFIRHVIFSDQWMIHANSQMKSTEKKKLLISKKFSNEIKPYIQQTVSKIYNKLNLDYFGIDCFIDKNMDILVFEINATMNIFAELENSVFKKHAEKANNALVNMLLHKKVDI